MEDWINVEPTEGTGNSQVKVTIEANTSSEARSAELRVKASGGGNAPEDKVITVTQDGAAPDYGIYVVTEYRSVGIDTWALFIYVYPNDGHTIDYVSQNRPQCTLVTNEGNTYSFHFASYNTLNGVVTRIESENLSVSASEKSGTVTIAAGALYIDGVLNKEMTFAISW